MANEGRGNSHQPTWVNDLKESISTVRDDIRDVRTNVRDMRSEMVSFRDDVDELKDALGGQNGIRERLKEVELVVANLADRETTPVSIVTQKKSTPKEQAALAGGIGGIGAIVLYVLQLAGEYLKTK